MARTHFLSEAKDLHFSTLPTYLYCLVPSGRVAPPESLLGVDDAAVRVLSLGTIDAWVSTIRGPLPDRTHDIRSASLGIAHDRVVSAALAGGVTPLPARAGQRFADDDECVASLSERRATDETALARLDGLVEMTATLVLGSPAAAPAPSPPPDAGPGRRHLDALRNRAAAVEHVREDALEAAAAISLRVQPLVRDAAVRVRVAPRVGVAVSHLVARAHVDEYRARLADHTLAGYDGRVTVTGPVAPYSFVAEPAASES